MRSEAFSPIAARESVACIYSASCVEAVSFRVVREYARSVPVIQHGLCQPAGYRRAADNTNSLQRRSLVVDEPTGARNPAQEGVLLRCRPDFESIAVLPHGPNLAASL